MVNVGKYIMTMDGMGEIRPWATDKSFPLQWDPSAVVVLEWVLRTHQT